MAREVVWSRRARADLRAVVTWIPGHLPGNAATVARRIVARVAGLSDQPGQGRRVPEIEGDETLREVIVQSWRIIYRVSDAEVVVVAVVHSARLLGDVAPF